MFLESVATRRLQKNNRSGHLFDHIIISIISQEAEKCVISAPIRIIYRRPRPGAGGAKFDDGDANIFSPGSRC